MIEDRARSGKFTSRFCWVKPATHSGNASHSPMIAIGPASVHVAHNQFHNLWISSFKIKLR